MERTVAHTSVNLGIASCSGRTLRAACPSANRSFALHRAAKRSIMPGAWQTTNSASNIQHTVVAAVAAPPRVASPEQSPLTSDVGPKDAPLRSLFPPENPPPAPGAPKLKVAIVGSGLAGLSTAVELLDQGYVRAYLLCCIQHDTDHHRTGGGHLRAASVCWRQGGQLQGQGWQPHRDGPARVFWVLLQPLSPDGQVRRPRQPAAQGTRFIRALSSTRV